MELISAHLSHNEKNPEMYELGLGEKEGETVFLCASCDIRSSQPPGLRSRQIPPGVLAYPLFKS